MCLYRRSRLYGLVAAFPLVSFLVSGCGDGLSAGEDANLSDSSTAAQASEGDVSGAIPANCLAGTARPVCPLSVKTIACVVQPSEEGAGLQQVTCCGRPQDSRGSNVVSCAPAIPGVIVTPQGDGPYPN
jgi:hypothetical protein